METISNKEKAPEVQIGKTSRSSMMYDLSIFMNYGEITSIRIFYLNCLVGLEMFINGSSIGVIHAPQISISKNEVKSEKFELNKDEKIIEISGKKSEDVIYYLSLKTTSKNCYTIGNPNCGEDFSFKFDNYYIRSLKVALNENSVCFIEPKFDLIRNFHIKVQNFIFCDDKVNNQTKTLGKANKNTKLFNDYEHLVGKTSNIKEIKIYDDGDYVKGIYFNYDVAPYLAHLDQRCPKTKDNYLKLEQGEYINKIYVRSGDWIDHLSIYTNKGNVISGGGFGGGPSIFVVPEGKKFIAIAGGHSNYLNCFSAFYE